MTAYHAVEGHCTICEKYVNLLHWHHTIPRSCGGEDSLQIPLCPDCHNLLHANASAVVAKINSGTPITRVYWKTQTEMQNAQRWLGILVNALLHPSEVHDKTLKMMLELPADIHAALKVFTQTKKVSNLQDAALLCIVETLKNKGFYNGRINQQHQKPNSGSVKGSKRDLW